jgi:hypothetical protein
VIGIADSMIGTVLDLALVTPCEHWTPLDAGGFR